MYACCGVFEFAKHLLGKLPLVKATSDGLGYVLF